MKTASEIARVQAIAEYGVVERDADASLEALARLAATLCRVPTATVNLLDDRRQYQVAVTGFEGGICSIEDSMCAVVLPDVRRVVVPDARRDDRFADNPFVTGERGSVRFYASSPLVTPGGVAIGTLCV
ncbi:MAG TPA: GAF domain-containing protein, partial [Microbacterium sp.]|nr:GAF domain-containing protein [Microbacterium sp.]